MEGERRMAAGAGGGREGWRDTEGEEAAPASGAEEAAERRGQPHLDGRRTRSWTDSGQPGDSSTVHLPPALTTLLS